MIKTKNKIVEGRLDKNRAGFAFLIRSDGVKPDIYIKKQNQKTAMDNDIVRAEIISSVKTSKPEGRVTAVLKRASMNPVGTFVTENGIPRVIPLGASYTIDLTKNDLLKQARDGDRVLVRLERIPARNRNALGSITRIIGPGGDYETEIMITLIHSGIRTEFGEPVTRETAAIPSGDLKPDRKKKREDFRHLGCFTIDPESARDFDDAVSIKKTGSGYELGVHIADVTHYVREGSAIDAEAFKRGTSVYLVDRVIPMLPEALSNDLCSLKPGVDRFALSLMISLDAEGKVKKHSLAKSIIRSVRRFTYEEVDAVLEGKSDIEKGLEGNLLEMVKLAKTLRANREKRGAIDFDFPELRVEMNPDGTVRAVKREERTMSHRLIEEFMILANEVVASHTSAKEIPSLYRVHEKPSAEKMEAFRDFVQIFGFTIPEDKKVTPQHLQTILSRIRNSREEVVISTMMLRSLQQAVYSNRNLGHFALASKNYTHFTSPIRRYPDLIVHRILGEIIRSGKLSPEKKKFYEERLEEWGQGLSLKERAAGDAERESQSLKLMEHMKDRTGDVFTGIISGVTSFGVFVELQTGLEGLIHIKQMKDDYYIFSENEMVLRGKRTKKEFRIGGDIEVRLVKIDMEKREVDFLPA